MATERLKGYTLDEAISVENIKRGDIVFVKSIGYDAEVLMIDREHNNIRVRLENKEIEVPLSDVSFGKGICPKGVLTDFTFDSAEGMPLQLNIIGLRVDEALSRVEPFLNHAFMENINEVTIIHGVGRGTLMQAVRDYLKGHPFVKSFRKGDLSEGGNGVTLVMMK